MSYGRKCPSCGGDCKKKDRGGETVYVCTCCGNVYGENEQGAGDTGDVSDGRIMTGKEIFDENVRSSVVIAVDGISGSSEASGIVISNTGLIITNAHAVFMNRTTPYGKTEVIYGDKRFDAKIIAAGAPFDGKPGAADLALLFAEGLRGKSGAARLGSSKKVSNGDKVYVIGNSLGEGLCITTGVVSDCNRSLGDGRHPYIMTDAAVNPGNSGGALINEKGEIIGVVVAATTGAKGMNYAIPVDYVKQFLQQVKQDAGFNDKIYGKLLCGYIAKTVDKASFEMIITGIKLFADVVKFVWDLFNRKQ